MELIYTLNALLTDKLGPLGPLIAVGFLGFLMILVTLPTLLKRRIDPLSKLRDTRRAQSGDAVKAQAKLRMGGRGEKLDKFAAFLEPKTEEEMSSAKLKLLRAGYRGKHAVRSFHAIQFVLGVSFLLLGAGRRGHGVLRRDTSSARRATARSSSVIGASAPASPSPAARWITTAPEYR